ncbi:MAG: hypothetical protein DRH21_05750 [Deltaproteobacteria bacterium]|nr:MAG: hypothetical protein DRH21_05750 [Deltaproteobacteria bacterium]
MQQIDKMYELDWRKNWIKISEKLVKGRNFLYYGYCMFLTSAATDVYAHLSKRKVSTGFFLPVTKKWERDWRISSDFNSISNQ